MSTVPDVLVELWFVCDRHEEGGDPALDGPLLGPFPTMLDAQDFAYEYAVRYGFARLPEQGAVWRKRESAYGYLDVFLGQLAAPEVLAARGGYCSRPTQLDWLGADGEY